MSLKQFFVRSGSIGSVHAAKAAPSQVLRPARNANVAALAKHVNESEKYSFESIHKALGAAMGKLKSKA